MKHCTIWQAAKKNIFTPGYIKVKNSRFKKLNFSPWLKKYLDRENIVLPASPFTEEVLFTSTVIFPSNIVKVNTKDVTISKNQKEVKQTFHLIKVTSGKADTGIRVKY